MSFPNEGSPYYIDERNPYVIEMQRGDLMVLRWLKARFDRFHPVVAVVAVAVVAAVSELVTQVVRQYVDNVFQVLIG